MGSSNEAIVYESDNPVELSLAKNLLEVAGIPHVVHGGMTSALFSVRQGSVFSRLQRIAVRSEDKERALGVFDEAWGPEEPES